MPLRRGANGLNLTEAQHVILLEPVLDPGAEAQAMKRVDRIGQTRPTCVHRFLLSGDGGKRAGTLEAKTRGGAGRGGGRRARERRRGDGAESLGGGVAHRGATNAAVTASVR